MVWLYFSLSQGGRGGGVISSFEWFIPSFPFVEEGGVEVGTPWIYHTHPLVPALYHLYFNNFLAGTITADGKSVTNKVKVYRAINSIEKTLFKATWEIRLGTPCLLRNMSVANQATIVPFYALLICAWSLSNIKKSILDKHDCHSEICIWF